MRERLERVERPGTYVTFSFTLTFFLGPVFVRTALPFSGGHQLKRGGVNGKKDATTKNQGAGVKYLG